MTMVEISSESLTDAQWEIAHAIAQTLVKEQLRLDAKSDGVCTELKKTVTYLRAFAHKPDATSKFFKYLKTLVSNGRQIGHSGRTPDYYRSIDKACNDYLKGIQDAYTVLQILGWVSRLIRYYKDAGIPIGEIATPTAPNIESTRQAEIPKPSSNYNFIVGQIVEAKVVNIEKQEIQDERKTKQRTTITYEIKGSICLSKEEINRQEISLFVGDIVKVKIEKVQGTSIRKVKKIIQPIITIA